MKNTTTFKRYLLAAAVSVVAMLTTGVTYAAEIVCPQYTSTDGDYRQYQTTGASDCVWGADIKGKYGNIGNGANDGFLNFFGINDEAYGNLGPTFGLIWTMIDSQNASAGGIQGSLSGLTVSGSDNNTFSWSLTATGFDKYALGLVDGGDPKWAVFLLSDTAGIANIISSGGSWSHVVLYGSNNTPCTENCSPPPNEIPEPGTLALMGLALLGGAAIRRRKV